MNEQTNQDFTQNGEIVVKTNVDLKAMTRMASFQLFKLRRNSFIITTIALIVGTITSIYAIVTEADKALYIVILVVLPLLYIFLFFLSPKLTAKSTFKKLNLEPGSVIHYTYTFHEEQFDVDLFFGEVEKANDTLNYQDIKKVYEYKEFLYVLMKEGYAFIINKPDNSVEAIEKVKSVITAKLNA